MPNLTKISERKTRSDHPQRGIKNVKVHSKHVLPHEIYS